MASRDTAARTATTAKSPKYGAVEEEEEDAFASRETVNAAATNKRATKQKGEKKSGEDNSAEDEEFWPDRPKWFNDLIVLILLVIAVIALIVGSVAVARAPNASTSLAVKELNAVNVTADQANAINVVAGEVRATDLIVQDGVTDGYWSFATDAASNLQLVFHASASAAPLLVASWSPVPAPVAAPSSASTDATAAAAAATA